MPEITVTFRGPVFTGVRQIVMRQLLQSIEDVVVEDGISQVREEYDSSHRHPTGHARSRVSREGPRVTTGGIVYGAWLEGVGSRNATTRFKGYFSFRKATQRLDARVPALVAPSVSRAVARLNA